MVIEILRIICCQEYSKKRAKDHRIIISQLQDRLNRMLESQNIKYEEHRQMLIDKTKLDLNEIVEEKTKGIIFRSKARWYNEAEKPTSYFLSLEKNRSGMKNVTIILNANREEKTNQKEILKEMERYYEKLYTSDESVEFDYVNNYGVKITDEQSKNLDEDISMDELQNAIKESKRGVSPGGDGITTEFYIMFFPLIKETLYNCIRFSLSTGKLHNSALKGLITCIPKARKDSRILDFLRPITLLNSDYKYLEKIIANRLKPVLNDLIHQDQKGYLQNRRLSANVRFILDLIDHLNNEKEEGLLLQIDYEKCFDRIEHNSLFAAMKFFGMGEKFIKWCKILYKGSTSCITNCGEISDPFRIGRSVKQGGPASCYFFLICAEVLALLLRDCKNISAFKIGDFKKLFGQYADDMDLYFKNKKENIKHVLDLLGEFSQRSGFKINLNKTTMYRIGYRQENLAHRYSVENVREIKDKVNVLGVNINNDLNKLQEENYNELLDKSKGILELWKGRQLSLHGKVLIINSLVASLFVHRMYVMDSIQSKYIKQFEKLITKFIWNGRWPKIPLEKLQNSKECGGLNLVDIQLKDRALKASWVHYVSLDEQIANFAHKKLSIVLKNEIWSCNLKSDDVLLLFKQSFWTDVLKSWCNYNYSENVNYENLMCQRIWYNSSLRIGGKPFVMATPFEKNLKFYHQILNDNGKLLSCDIMREKFGFTVMQYNALVSSIPALWKDMAKKGKVSNVKEQVKTKAEQFMTSIKPVNLYYKTMQAKFELMKNTYIRWQFRISTDLEYKSFFEIVRKYFENNKS